jgi:hypothetical protein
MCYWQKEGGLKMALDYSERGFETDVEEGLISLTGGFARGSDEGYDPALGIWPYEQHSRRNGRVSKRNATRTR